MPYCMYVNILPILRYPCHWQPGAVQVAKNNFCNRPGVLVCIASPASAGPALDSGSQIQETGLVPVLARP